MGIKVQQGVREVREKQEVCGGKRVKEVDPLKLAGKL